MSAPLRTLHVAAMPFPSPQGTQAAVRAMVEALVDAGRETHLLTYGVGTTPAGPMRFTWHKLAHRTGRNVVPVRSLRSGPSIGKVVLDLQLAATLRRLHRRLRPDLVVAHHVEACAAAWLAGARPLLFVAHTALEPELPTYFPRAVARPTAAAGLALDRDLARRADAVAAIAPALADYFERRAGVPPHPLPVPWTLPEPIRKGERLQARHRFGLADTDEVGLYAGNLDAYQGWPQVVQALARTAATRPGARLLVATESDPRAVHAAARGQGVAERVRVIGLGDEASRRSAHAAADLALVPRRTPGGLPIKLLDALARGVPTAVTRTATAGLDLEGAALLVNDDDPEALAGAWRAAVQARRATAEVAERGRAYVATRHTPGGFLRALDAVADAMPLRRA
ncbi:MAG: glycosyltransferase [Myxococcota bacterium]